MGVFLRGKRESFRQFSELPRVLSSWWVGRKHSGAHFLASAPEPALEETPAVSTTGAEGDRHNERWQCGRPGPNPSGSADLECLGPGEPCRTLPSRPRVPALRFPADRVRLRKRRSSLTPGGRCGRPAGVQTHAQEPPRDGLPWLRRPETRPHRPRRGDISYLLPLRLVCESGRR